MSGNFSYSSSLLEGSSYIRWSDGNDERQIRRKCGKDDQSVCRRPHHMFPGARALWRRIQERRIMNSMEFSTSIEIRSGHTSQRRRNRSNNRNISSLLNESESSAAPRPENTSSSRSSGVLSIALETGRDRLLLSGGLDGRVCLYRLDTPPESCQNNNGIPGMRFGSIVGQGDERPQTVIWPIESSELMINRESVSGQETGHTGAVSTVQWYPEDPPGAFLSSSFDGTLLIWDTEHFEVAGSFNVGSKIFVSKINNSSHSGLVACGTAQRGTCLCDLRTGDAVHTLHVPISHGSSSMRLGSGSGSGIASVKALDWSPCGDGHLLVTGSSDGCVRLWDIRKGGSANRSYVMSFDAQHNDHQGGDLLENDVEKRTSTHNATNKKRSRGIEYDGDDEDSSCIDFSSRQSVEELYSKADESDQKQFGSLSSKLKKRQQLSAGCQAVDWSRESAAVAHKGTEVVALKYSPSGAHLVSCGNDGEVALWGTASGKKFPQHFSPRCCKTKLRYDIEIASFGGVGDELLLYPQGGQSSGDVGNIVMTPLHSRTGDNIHLFHGHVDDVCAMQFSGDKSRLVTAGKDGMIFLWEGSRKKKSLNREEKENLSVVNESRHIDATDYWLSEEEDDIDVGGDNAAYIPPILLQR